MSAVRFAPSNWSLTPELRGVPGRSHVGSLATVNCATPLRLRSGRQHSEAQQWVHERYRMNDEQFARIVARLEHQSAASPGRYRAKVAALALLGFAILPLLRGATRSCDHAL
jgi:hypothetical protein